MHKVQHHLLRLTYAKSTSEENGIQSALKSRRTRESRRVNKQECVRRTALLFQTRAKGNIVQLQAHKDVYEVVKRNHPIHVRGQ